MGILLPAYLHSRSCSVCCVCVSLPHTAQGLFFTDAQKQTPARFSLWFHIFPSQRKPRLRITYEVLNKEMNFVLTFYERCIESYIKKKMLAIIKINRLRWLRKITQSKPPSCCTEAPLFFVFLFWILPQMIEEAIFLLFMWLFTFTSHLTLCKCILLQ